MPFKLSAIMCCCMMLGACVTTRPTLKPAGWAERAAGLQNARFWTLDGRVAVAVGTQGWQASLNWRQRGADSEARLAGPLGVGAVVLAHTAQGLAIDGASADESTLARLHDRLGFDLPLDNLRYWLLGVPDPSAPYESTRNEQDRLLALIQAGWTVSYDRYAPVDGDLLPARLVLSRDAVRVRVAVDHWTLQR